MCPSGYLPSVQIGREQKVTAAPDSVSVRELRSSIFPHGKPYFESGNDDCHYHEPDHPHDGYCRKLRCGRYR